MCDDYYRLGVVSQLQHLRDPGDLGVTMEVIGGGVVTPLGVVRQCGRKVPLRGPWTCMEVRA
jgi:hypothetical protein